MLLTVRRNTAVAINCSFSSALSDERQDIQKKTFTKWINSHLIKTQCAPVNDLFLDLRDGNRLLALLSVLTDTQLKPVKGRMRVHNVNNLKKALQVTREHGTKLVNIFPDGIVSGEPTLAAGFGSYVVDCFDSFCKKVLSSFRMLRLSRETFEGCKLSIFISM
uniref:Calponin-homology (CH) domain-containing protein n=1 Tax=Glossina pallidipes TaxID=7398 RepID=A0A1A9ZXV9_GLOPL